MKVTTNIPDDLYRQVKARSAMLGLAVREVTIELYQRWLQEPPTTTPAPSAEQWLDDWTELGDTTLRQAPDGPTATEIVAGDRGRLDRADPC